MRFSFLLLFSLCFSTLFAQSNKVKSFTITAPADRVFDQAVLYLMEGEFVMGDLDRASGLIKAQRYSKFRHDRRTYTFFVSQKSADTTLVAMQIFMERRWTDASDVYRPLYLEEIGLLDQELLEDMRIQLSSE